MSNARIEDADFLLGDDQRRKELNTLFDSQNTSSSNDGTSSPARFVRAAVAVS
jgi:hypothetical protein